MTFFALSFNIKGVLKLKILWYTPKNDTLLLYYNLKQKIESILINNIKVGVSGWRSSGSFLLRAGKYSAIKYSQKGSRGNVSSVAVGV